MKFKHVMNAAMIASLMTSFLVACAPANNPKAKGLNKGTGNRKLAPRTDPQAQKVTQAVGLPPVTLHDKEAAKALLGASIAVEPVKEGKGFVVVAKVILGINDKAEVVIGKGTIDAEKKNVTLQTANGCGEESKFDLHVACPTDSCNSVLLNITKKGEESPRIPVTFERVKESTKNEYEITHSEKLDEDNKIVRDSAEEIAEVNKDKVTCADVKKSTDDKAEGNKTDDKKTEVIVVPDKPEAKDAANEGEKKSEDVKSEEVKAEDIKIEEIK